MKVNHILTEAIAEKDYIPAGVKQNTCAAVAYHILTGINYNKALQLLPDGKPDRITTVMSKLGLQAIKPEQQNYTLHKFLNEHLKGSYFVIISQTGHATWHAVAVIDGIAYNTQTFTEQAQVESYYDFSNIQHQRIQDTAFVDEMNIHDIDKNKYIIYVNKKIMDMYGPKLSNNNNAVVIATINSSNGFELKINNKIFTFEFPLNCTERDVYSIIDDTIEKTKIN